MWNPAGADWTTQTNAAQALLPSVNGETVLFWLHLMASDLITGVTNRALSAPPNGTPLWGETHPTAKIGGGFIIGWGNGNRPPGAPVGVVGPSGLLVVIAGAPAGDLTTTAGVQPLHPSRAAQIDRKMDDGISSLGSVMSYGPTASCFTGGTAANSYNETISANDCGLIIRLGQ